MSPAEALWFSGLLVGIVLGLPLGVLVDRFVLRPAIRTVLSLTRPVDDRGA